jgi:hypothetical protein
MKPVAGSDPCRRHLKSTQPVDYHQSVVCEMRLHSHAGIKGRADDISVENSIDKAGLSPLRDELDSGFEIRLPCNLPRAKHATA